MKNKYKVLVGLLVISLAINVSILYNFNDDINLLEDFYINETREENFESIRIPDIYQKDVKLFGFEENVQVKNDFSPWKNELLQKFQEYQNIPNFDDIELSNVLLVKEERLENYKITKFSTNAQDNDKIIFYELIPENENKMDSCESRNCFPTVLIIPGSGNQGAKDVINAQGELSPYYYHKGIGEKLVKLGYVVFVIENRGWGERLTHTQMNCEDPDIFCSGNKLHKHLMNLGYDQFSLQVIDTIQVFKHIQSLEYVNTEKISVAGLSLGGPVAVSVSSLAPNVHSTIAASGIISQQMTGGGSNPGALKYYDQPDIVASLAPNPLYLSWGINEKSEFGHEAEKLYSASLIKKAYKLFDEEDNLEIIIHDDEFNQGHTFEINSLIKFLEDTIG
tara:strand:+ start:1268 stop:2446 length:1179 start_codon:yes stop_codon:yes gene_type:complete